MLKAACACVGRAAGRPSIRHTPPRADLPVPLRHLAAVRGRPSLGVVEEGADIAGVGGIEQAGRLGRRQHVAPGGEAVQADAELGERLDAWEDSVMEYDERVLHLPLRLADGADEVDLAAAVG